MKKNAVLLASITFIAAGCAHQGGSARYDTGSSSSPASSANFSTENPIRNPDGSLQTPASIASQHDPGSYSDFDVSNDTSTQTDTIRARGEEPYSSSENSAVTATSDDENQSPESSANRDDLLRDGVFTDTPEINNDASVGGAATTEVGKGSSDVSTSPGKAADEMNEERDLSRGHDLEDATDELQPE